jgi:hypothetical protein
VSTPTGNYFENFDSHLEEVADCDDTEMGTFMSDFLIQTLNTQLLDGAIRVSDEDFLPPSRRNNFLLSDDGKCFSGFVTTGLGETYEFDLFEHLDKWSLKIQCEAVK